MHTLHRASASADAASDNAAPFESSEPAESAEPAHGGELFARLVGLPVESPERARIREHLVRMYLPLCHRLAIRYLGRGEPMEDLLQAATVGLVKAIDRFDPGYGSEFTSFAIPTILGELKRHFRDTVWRVHAPRRSQELRLAVAVAADELTRRTGRSATVSELAGYIGIGTDEVQEGLEAIRAYQSTSLDAPLDADGEAGPTLADRLGEEDRALEGVDNHESLGPLLAALPERSRRIVLLRFYGNQTQSQIAAAVGVSQMHVSRLLARALADLRAGLLGET